MDILNLSISNFLLDCLNNRDLFFIDLNKTYRDFIIDIFNQKEALKNKSFKKVIIATENPYETFCLIFATFLSRIECTLISSLEPETQILKIQSAINAEFCLNYSDTDFNLREDEIRGFLNNNIFDPEDLVINVLSSGSTRESKEIRHNLKTLSLSALNFIKYFDSNKKDIFLLNLPHHHVGGLMVLWRAFYSQASISTQSLISCDRFSYISLVPLQLSRALNNDASLKKLQNAKAILIGGAVLDPELKNESLNNKLKIYETYGMSESASFISLNGHVLDGNEIILDDNNHILIKSNHLSPDAILDSNGFFKTNDIGQIKDGKIFFVHRADLLFKSAGELINPEKVETLIKSHPKIINCICTSVKHFILQNAQVCLYESIDNETIDLKAFLRSQIHPYLIPRYFFKLPPSTFKEGLKPKRFEFKLLAEKLFLQSLFSFKYINNNSKDTLLVLHGFMEDKEDHHFLENLIEVNLLLIDLPGHGTTSIDEFSTDEEIYYYLKEFLNLFNLTFAYGYSMGGRVIIELINRDFKINKLFLVSSHFGLSTIKEKEIRLNSDKMLFSNIKSLKSFLNSWYENPIFTGYKNSIEYKNNIERKLNHNYEKWQKAIELFSPGNSKFNLNDSISKLKNIKVVGITGSLDTKYTSHYRELENKLNDFTHIELSNVGHNPHKIIPNKVFEIIKKGIK